MTYIVLARRWRPQQFQDIIGQDHVSTTLSNSIVTGRIAHSFIFSGPRGVGKTTAARILAKALNCEKGPTKTPCNSCSACESITKGSSLDVLEIDGASNRGIDEIRNLRENIRFTPSQGKYRIYIIDEVHMLTKEAFNALLKTLEEPPKHAIFIFATTEIHRVPATILSRCQRFDFKRIPTKTIIEHLKNICKKEKISISDDALLQIAKKADGSMRDAQSILDQIISYSGEKISTEEVASALGIIDQEIYFQFTEKIQDGDLKEILSLCQSIYREGYDFAEFLVGFEEHLRNMLVTKTVGNTELLNVSEHFAESYQKESQKFEENDLLRYIQQIGDLQNSLKWATQAQMKFEIGLLKLAKMPTTVNIENILEKLDLLKKKSETIKKAPEPDTPKVDQSPSKPPLNLKEMQSYWIKLVEEYRNSKVNLANALEFGKPVELKKTDLFLEYAKKNSFHISWFKKHQRTIENQLRNHFQETIKVSVQVVETDEDVQDSSPDKPLDKDSANKMIKDDPLLNKLVEELGLELT
ncbi:MAG: DNA polymerase III subunit gamma/tau [Calditrichia bacterium]|jgi:DNA polymerase-3 subunit gamma/tau|nr:DNA polymerase III subunit gamma/tau [Calditrichia bacterium]